MSEMTKRFTHDNEKTIIAGKDAMTGKRKGLAALLPFVGPAFIASIAYIDPGNYATNIAGGAQFGYKLLWVIVIANIMGILFQNMSAKLGIATGRSLPELCREHFPVWLAYIMWLFSELAAMATDLAEFLGATLALNLLFHIPMVSAFIITGVITYAILALDRFGFRPLEKIIAVFALSISICYLLEIVLAHPSFSQVAYHSIVPWISGKDSIMIVVGIIGATVMPHAIYLHSGLTQRRIIPKTDNQKLRIQKFSTIEIYIAMGLAGLVNLSMMAMSAAVFFESGHTSVASIETAYQTLTPLLGPASAAVFLGSLLASGLSSSAVGTMAGQLIMQGFVGFSIPVWIRRIVTMIPAFIIVIIGLDATQTLVVSQVILSIVLPMPIVALIYFTRKKDLMGILVNKKITTAFAVVSAFIIIVLNMVLLYQALVDLLA